MAYTIKITRTIVTEREVHSSDFPEGTSIDDALQQENDRTIDDIITSVPDINNMVMDSRITVRWED